MPDNEMGHYNTFINKKTDEPVYVYDFLYRYFMRTFVKSPDRDSQWSEEVNDYSDEWPFSIIVSKHFR